MFVPFELVGQTIEHYQISEFIGRGPMGFVYRATDTKNQQTVTLKLFLKSSGEAGEIPEEVEKPFFEEARALRGLVHPQVASVLDVGETEEFRYICTEFVLGKSLDDLLNEQGALPIEKALPLFQQLLSALQAAQEINIVHRNLKPANILIQRNGQIKITDFGQSKIPSMAATVALTGTGSPFYMSPEAILGQRGDIRSDIFSVGALLYRVLTGEKPFDGESTATIVQRVVEQDPAFPKLINPHIPEELGILCTKAMAKDPSQRYQTPQEMLDALTAFQPLGSERGIHHPGRPNNQTAPPSTPVRQRTRKTAGSGRRSLSPGPIGSIRAGQPGKDAAYFTAHSSLSGKTSFQARRRPRKKAGKGNQKPKIRLQNHLDRIDFFRPHLGAYPGDHPVSQKPGRRLEYLHHPFSGSPKDDRWSGSDRTADRPDHSSFSPFGGNTPGNRTGSNLRPRWNNCFNRLKPFGIPIWIRLRPYWKRPWSWRPKILRPIFNWDAC